MSFFKKKLRAFAVVAVGLTALLLGSCVISPAGLKRPLGPPADVATHAPELIGMWKLTQICGHEPAADMLLVFKTDGFGAEVHGEESVLAGGITTSDGKPATHLSVVDRGFEWSTDESVLFHVTYNDVWGDYDVSGDILRIKYRDRNDCKMAEYKLMSRDTNWKYKVIQKTKEIIWERD